MEFFRIEEKQMKKIFIIGLVVFVAAMVLAIAALFEPVGYSARATFECATQLDARKAESCRGIDERKRVCDAIDGFFRNKTSLAKSFRAKHAGCCDDAVMVSNAFATCLMKVREISDREPTIVDAHVSAKSEALACLMVDFLVDGFRSWLESQSQIAFDKNTAEFRVAISKARQSGREPDCALVGRLASAKEAFERDRLKIRVIERPHVVSVRRVWKKLFNVDKEVR